MIMKLRIKQTRVIVSEDGEQLPSETKTYYTIQEKTIFGWRDYKFHKYHLKDQLTHDTYNNLSYPTIESLNDAKEICKVLTMFNNNPLYKDVKKRVDVIYYYLPCHTKVIYVDKQSVHNNETSSFEFSLYMFFKKFGGVISTHEDVTYITDF